MQVPIWWSTEGSTSDTCWGIGDNNVGKGPFVHEKHRGPGVLVSEVTVRRGWWMVLALMPLLQPF